MFGLAIRVGLAILFGLATRVGLAILVALATLFGLATLFALTSLCGLKILFAFAVFALEVATKAFFTVVRVLIKDFFWTDMASPFLTSEYSRLNHSALT